LFVPTGASRVDHVTVYRWVQRFTPLLAEAARPCRHAVGDRWQVDETYVKVAGRWRYVYRAIDQFGQVIDVLVSAQRDARAARRFFERAIGTTSVAPPEVVTDRAATYPVVLDELLPAAWHRTDRYANNHIEAYERGPGLSLDGLCLQALWVSSTSRATSWLAPRAARSRRCRPRRRRAQANSRDPIPSSDPGLASIVRITGCVAVVFPPGPGGIGYRGEIHQTTALARARIASAQRTPRVMRSGYAYTVLGGDRRKARRSMGRGLHSGSPVLDEWPLRVGLAFWGTGLPGSSQ
jgi:transposase-like protein